MTMDTTYLPEQILNCASLRGHEFAWSITDIPQVIAEAKAANLVTIGGQLQFRLRNGVTCECYWVEVETLKTIPPNMSWEEKVVHTAVEANRQFKVLTEQVDFLSEGRKAFAKLFSQKAATDSDLTNAMCFVWYFETIGE